jgi:hypothetical protein
MIAKSLNTKRGVDYVHISILIYTFDRTKVNGDIMHHDDERGSWS